MRCAGICAARSKKRHPFWFWGLCSVPVQTIGLVGTDSGAGGLLQNAQCFVSVSKPYPSEFMDLFSQ